MSLKKLIDILNDCCNDIAFSFGGKQSGVMPEVANHKKTYHVWYGEKTKDYLSVDELVNDRFFDGKSIKEIFNELDIIVS